MDRYELRREDYSLAVRAATAHLVRARGWPLAAGDPGASAQQIAAIVASRA